MIYPKEYEAKVSFDRIREQTSRLCQTALGREILERTRFSADYATVETSLVRCNEMRTIIMMDSAFPADGYVDLQRIIRKLEIIGTFLESDEMVLLHSGLTVAGELIKFFNEKEEGVYLRLREIAAGIDSFPQIIKQIDRIIDRFGKVRDNASPELQRLRRAISEREGQVSKLLGRLLREGQSAGVIDADASISVREGRAVIPVSAANKRRIKGLIHDESATGKTFYIEPIEVVELNNELRELEYDERREVVKILTAFTDSLRPSAPDIARTGEFIGTVDFIKAKALFAISNDCVMPLLSAEPRIELRNARHPLLAQTLAREGKQVVPLDLRLTPEKYIMVISGPNAGGKSVCLKTVGLLQYMLQSGFLIPASENSEMGIFNSIFLDIGDEQSIDNDLSTYSSHLLNMKTVLRNADSRSLVLIDEFGTGTEPVMGGAIAESVLEQLEAKHVFGVITTHYSNLKYYASNAKGIVNGAMSFDVQNIRPLFRLETGKPGSSFAIEIARKIGLPEEIIKSASEKIGSERINIERQLREIARDKKYWEDKRNSIRIAERRTDELAQKYEKELSAIKEEHNALIRKAKDEARQLLDDANRRIESTIREIKESQADKERTRESRRMLEEFRESFAAPDAAEDRIQAKMDRLREREQKRKQRKTEVSETPAETLCATPQKPLEAGDKIRIKGQDALGEVLSIDGDKARIAFGHITTTLPVERLESVSNSQYKKIEKERQSASRLSSNYDTSKRRLNFKQQIDIRGERAADAIEAVREFVDEAIMLGIREIRVLHGKGTGALKQEIRKYLATVDVVESATDEDEKFGGAGITVIKLDL